MNIPDIYTPDDNYEFIQPIEVYDLEKEDPKLFKLYAKRSEIDEKVGDTQSLLGTTADATALLLYGFTSLVAMLEQTGSEEQKKALKGLMDGKLVDLSKRFTEDVQEKKVKLPALEKGVESVVEDIKTRSTKVAEILKG